MLTAVLGLKQIAMFGGGITMDGAPSAIWRAAKSTWLILMRRLIGLLKARQPPPELIACQRVTLCFERLPLSLIQTLWWQYFGNNVYARRIWLQGRQWYKYSQGLHGGLDFGNSRDRSVQIVAGVTGTFKFHDRVYTRPSGLWIKVGDYTVIYGHLANPRLFRVGDTIQPATVLGELEYGGQNHLHLEVRYKDRWIINPLLLMPEAMRSSIISKFPPSEDYFYRSASWTQWQMPLDQPIITLGGPIIGPNA